MPVERTLIFDSNLAALLPGLLEAGPLLLSFLNAAGTVKHLMDRGAVAGASKMLDRRCEIDAGPAKEDRSMQGAENDGEIAMLRERVARAMLAKRDASAMVDFSTIRG